MPSTWSPSGATVWTNAWRRRSSDIGGPTVIIGMDTPQVTVDLLAAVVDRLCEPGVDAVLGPANDGGYWVIGLRAPDPRALLGVPMSSDQTHRAQRERLDQLGLVTATVAELTDLDTYDEAVAVAAVATGVRFRRTVEEIDRQLGSAGHR